MFSHGWLKSPRNLKPWSLIKLRNLVVLRPRMPPNHLYPIPQREPLIGIIRNRRIHRSVTDRDTRRRCNHPPNMPIRAVPHLDPEGQVARD
jgi:hypothetical protein